MAVRIPRQGEYLFGKTGWLAVDESLPLLGSRVEQSWRSVRQKRWRAAATLLAYFEATSALGLLSAQGLHKKLTREILSASTYHDVQDGQRLQTMGGKIVRLPCRVTSFAHVAFKLIPYADFYGDRHSLLRAT